MILITGSGGLIGTSLGARLTESRTSWRPFDMGKDPNQNTCDKIALATALEDVEGIVHLAAVSRVVWAERDPSQTERVNVDATEGLLRLAAESPCRPWVIFASSREVYGEQDRLPATEDAHLKPMNTYARSKLAGERLVEAASHNGLAGQILRFSNVYGSTDDHVDRVVPAFAASAARGGRIRVDGGSNTFDFTHVDDVSRGIARVCEAYQAGERFPPIHFLTGRGTTLRDLSEMAESNAREPVEIVEAPSRAFDVSRFYGDPDRARALLGWEAEIDIQEGFADLVQRFVGLGQSAEGAPPALQAECATA